MLLSGIKAPEFILPNENGELISLKDFLGKKVPAKGIKVEITESGTTIDVHVTVKFGIKINDVAQKLQMAVKNAVETYAGLENITVNVFVDGIEPEPKEKEAEETKEK